MGTGAGAAARLPPSLSGVAQPFSSPASLAAAPAAGEARAGPHPARLKRPSRARLAASFSAAGQGAGWADAGGRGEQLGAAAGVGGSGRSPAAGGESAAPAALQEGSARGSGLGTSSFGKPCPERARALLSNRAPSWDPLFQAHHPQRAKASPGV